MEDCGMEGCGMNELWAGLWMRIVGRKNCGMEELWYEELSDERIVGWKNCDKEVWYEELWDGRVVG